MATVIIGYGTRDQTPLETGLLEGMGFQVRHLAGLPDPPAAVPPGTGLAASVIC